MEIANGTVLEMLTKGSPEYRSCLKKKRQTRLTIEIAVAVLVLAVPAMFLPIAAWPMKCALSFLVSLAFVIMFFATETYAYWRRRCEKMEQAAFRSSLLNHSKGDEK